MLLCAISSVCIQGARVVMACRDMGRADIAAQEIRQATGNGNVVTRHLNLASLYSVHEFAKEFLATEERLDILINNAGKSRMVIFFIGTNHNKNSHQGFHLKELADYKVFSTGDTL